MRETSIDAMAPDALPAPASDHAADLAGRRAEDIEDEIATLAAEVAATTARMLELLAELDRRGTCGGEGFTSLAHWLSWRTGLDAVAAREHVRVARALSALPRTAAAFHDGLLSYSKVRALTRVARPETEEELVRLARHSSSAQLETIVRRLRRADPEAEGRQARQQQDRRSLEAFFDSDGMLVVHGRLPPEAGALVLRALDAARDTLFRERPKGVEILPGQARADALAWLAGRALAPAAPDGTGAEPSAHRASDHCMVVVHVDREALANPAADGRCELEDGPDVSAETARRLACDCSRLFVIDADADADGDSAQPEPGRRSRVLSAQLERALRERDGGRCTFPGCTHRILEAHHIEHWANGGATVLPNLLSCCHYHHQFVHEGGWTVELRPDGTAEWRRPDGRVLPSAPAPGIVGCREPGWGASAPTTANAHSLEPVDAVPTWSCRGSRWEPSGSLGEGDSAESSRPSRPRRASDEPAEDPAEDDGMYWGPEDGYSPGGCIIDLRE